MPTFKVQSNALPKIKNVMAMIDGVAEAPVSRAVVKEMSLLVGDIARTSMYGFIDGAARMNPKKLHHVYEWNKPGNRNYRLYYITDPVVGRAYRGKTFINMNIIFRQSKMPVPPTGFPKENKKHVFKFKAQVMEKGKPIQIFPKNGEFLVFRSPEYRNRRGRKSEDSFIFARSVKVMHPGGKEVKNGLRETVVAFKAVDLESKIANNTLVRGMEREFTRAAKGIAYNQASGRTFQSTHYKNMTKMKTARELINYLRASRYVYKAER
jgi:hypothetical protein